MIWPWPTMSIALWELTIVSRRPSMMNVAWRRRTGAGSESDEGESLAGRVGRGAMMDSSSMLEGKLARRREVMVGAEGECRRSLITSRGVFSNGVILRVPFLSRSSRMTWPASQGKLTHNRSRPLVNVFMVEESSEGEVEARGKQRHIWV